MKIPVKQYFQLLTAYLRPHGGRVILMTGVLLGGIALELLKPQVLRYYIDTATQAGPDKLLVTAALIFISIALGNQVLSLLGIYLSENVAWLATNALRVDLLRHILNLDLPFYKKYSPGEIIERVDGDVNTLANFFSKFVIDLLSNLVLMVGALGLLFYADWRVALWLTSFTLLAYLILVRMHAVMVPYWTAVNQSRQVFYGFLEERLGGVEDLRANGAVNYVMRRFHAIVNQWWEQELKAGSAIGVTGSISSIVFACGVGLTLGLGVYFYHTGSMSIGTVYLAFYYAELLSDPIQKTRAQMEDLQKAGASIERIKEWLRLQPAVRDGAGGPPIIAAPSVEFCDVNFSYAAEQITLQGVSFQLPAGKVLGVLGRTGSGKTTIARLLLRFYDPNTGHILLNGIPIHNLNLSELRRSVALVTQDVQLFRATLRDNLTFFDSSFSDERLVGVLQDLGLARWYQELPSGLDTELSADRVSAGEAQLIALARVFLRNPSFIILDEPSSRLDATTELLIDHALDKLLQGRTAVIIAHRLTTLGRADEILILERGRIIEFGERELLAQRADSRFRALLQAGLEEALA